MHIFVLFCLVAMFTWPYAAVSEIIRRAAENARNRVNLRKDIFISVLPAFYMIIVQRNVFHEEAVNNISSYMTLFGSISFVLYTFSVYIATQFVRIAFFDGGWDFRIFSVFAFVVIYVLVSLHALSHSEANVFAKQFTYIVLTVSGFLFFVFFAGIHSVFSKYILIVNMIGFVISFIEKGRIFYEDYFLLLDLLPDVTGGMGVVLIVASTLLAAHNYGVERGWFPPLIKI